MNPWQSLRREISGAVRSIRYDIAARKSRRRMNEDTVELPVIRRTNARRHLFVAALVPIAGIGGYLAMTSGVDALLPGTGDPRGLPYVAAKPKPADSPTAAPPLAPMMPVTTGPERHIRTTPPAPPVATQPTGTPPVPTPAPTCNCPTPTPAPTASPSPTPTPAPTGSPTSTPPPTSEATS